MIHALNVGYMITDFEPKRGRFPGEFAECPACGGRMHRDAQLCKKCRTAHADVFGPIDLEGKAERDHRFQLAEQAGWTVGELLELARNGELPTYEEIAARDIGVVIRAYCEGMGG